MAGITQDKEKDFVFIVIILVKKEKLENDKQFWEKSIKSKKKQKTKKNITKEANKTSSRKHNSKKMINK